jgi:hypothetical protein
MSDVARFFWGVVGAVVPEVVRLYLINTNQQPLPRFTQMYFIISLVFMALAGLFTIACRPKTPFRAIWIGIAFPPIVSLLMKTIPALPLSSP